VAAKNHIDLVQKTMRVLEALGESEAGSGLKKVAEQVDLVKSSVFRILYTLKELGYVEQAGSNGDYRLTLKMWALTRRMKARPTLVGIARPHLVRLRDELAESAWLAERRGGAVLLVDVAEDPHPLRLSYGVGDRCPLHATALGKAVAAHMSPAELEAALGQTELRRFTPYTIETRTQLQAELAEVRRLGYATNDQETVEGAVIIGAPVFDSTGNCFAAISVSALMVRCPARKEKAIIAAVKRAAAALTKELADLGFNASAASAAGAGVAGV
jgi:IclR family acetate operon transcriptional repressor